MITYFSERDCPPGAISAVPRCKAILVPEKEIVASDAFIITIAKMHVNPHNGVTTFSVIVYSPSIPAGKASFLVNAKSNFVHRSLYLDYKRLLATSMVDNIGVVNESEDDRQALDRFCEEAANVMRDTINGHFNGVFKGNGIEAWTIKLSKKHGLRLP